MLPEVLGKGAPFGMRKHDIDKAEPRKTPSDLKANLRVGKLELKGLP